MNNSNQEDINIPKPPKWLVKFANISLIVIFIFLVGLFILAFSNVERTEKFLSKINDKYEPGLCNMSYERNYLHQFSDDCFSACKGYLLRCPKEVKGNFSLEIKNHQISNCLCDGIVIVNPTWYEPKYELNYNMSD